MSDLSRTSSLDFRDLEHVALPVLRDREDQVVHLVRLGLLALAEGLELLELEAQTVLRDVLDLPAPEVLQALASEDYLVSKVRLALAGRLDPAVLGRSPSGFPRSTFGGSTVRRR